MTTFVQYEANGATASFTVPFPYLEQSHVVVRLNGVVHHNGVHYDFTGPSTVTFRPMFTPVANTTVEIRRETPSSALVTYQNAAVLTASDLNTAVKQSLYISEEIKDYYEGILQQGLTRLNNGTAVPVQDMIDAAVQSVLDSALLAELQTRIGDIDANAESLLTHNTTLVDLQDQIDALATVDGVGIATLIANEQTARINGDQALVDTIALLGAKSGDNTAFIADLNKLKVSPTESFAQRFSALAVTDAANNAAILSEQTARANADSALSSTISALSATVTNNNNTLTTRISNEETARANGDAAEASARATLAARVTNTETGLVSANAAIANEASVRASEDSAIASSVSTLQSTVNGNTASIQTQQTVINGLAAQYVVKTDVNGRVAGFGLYNTGATSEFIVLANKFAIVDPANNANVKVPFLVSGGVVYMQNVVIGGALIDNLTVNKLTAGTLTAQVTQNADWMIGTGRIIMDNGGFIKAQGVGFGSSNQFIEWFGPRPAGGNLALCTEANAIQYIKTNGDAYFGGSLSAGVLRNAATGSATASNAEVVLGPFGTNGSSKTVACSYTFHTTHAPEGELTFTNPPTATVVLERSFDGSSWTQIGTQSFSGSVFYFRGWGWAEPGEYSATIGGSFTVTDTNASMSNFYYRLRITARNVSIFQPGTIEQRLTIVSTEE